MLVEIIDNAIYIDKTAIAENCRLNIQPKNHQLRLKITYINGEVKTPIDIVIFNWSPKLDKLALSISINGKEMTTDTKFLLKLKYDVFKRQLKLAGKVGSEDVNILIANIRDFIEIPKLIEKITKKIKLNGGIYHEQIYNKKN